MEEWRDYIHGYSDHESRRLSAQASSVLDLLHSDTRYPPGSRVLEVGCGTGEQTITLARNSPEAHFVSFDRSGPSLSQARDRLAAAGLANVDFFQADLFALPFPTHSFDDVFVCFVLEHLPDPVSALQLLRGMLRPGGTLTVFEGDHGSAYFHPDSEAAQRAIRCQVELQRRRGGNACVGRQVHPLLAQSGFHDIRVMPRMVYVDPTRPSLVDLFVRRTFTHMVEAVRPQALDADIIDAHTFDQGIRDLYHVADTGGVFCYTFFKGVGVNPCVTSEP